jgi:hypothetical protein
MFPTPSSVAPDQVVSGVAIERKAPEKCPLWFEDSMDLRKCTVVERNMFETVE